MEIVTVSKDEYLQLLTAALKDGIAGMRQQAVKTEGQHFLFIEPEKNHIEAYYRHYLALRMRFYPDNKTWDESYIGRSEDVETDQILYGFKFILDRIMKEKGEHVDRRPIFRVNNRNRIKHCIGRKINLKKLLTKGQSCDTIKSRKTN